MKWLRAASWLFGSLIFLSVLLAGVSLVLFRGSCSNQQYQLIPSPDGSLNAVIFERNCGATTGFSTQISILDGNEVLGNRAGNIFVGDGHPSESLPKVSWLSENQLSIRVRSSVRVYSRGETWGWPWRRIEVVYD